MMKMLVRMEMGEGGGETGGEGCEEEGGEGAGKGGGLSTGDSRLHERGCNLMKLPSKVDEKR